MYSPWGFLGGINAGVILLKPCSKTFQQMFSEVTSVVHPAHVPGSGPEQDYLSRFLQRRVHHGTALARSTTSSFIMCHSRWKLCSTGESSWLKAIGILLRPQM